MILFYFIDNPFLLENEKTKAVKVPSTNTQYGFDSVKALEGILELEFGFRKSFPAVIAQLCKHYVQIFNCGLDSCIWLGAGVGRGPFEFTNVFQNVSTIKRNIKGFKIMFLLEGPVA